DRQRGDDRGPAELAVIAGQRGGASAQGERGGGGTGRGAHDEKDERRAPVDKLRAVTGLWLEWIAGASLRGSVRSEPRRRCRAVGARTSARRPATRST